MSVVPAGAAGGQGVSDDLMPQFLKEEFHRHLEQMAEEERIGKARVQTSLLPVVYLRSRGMTQEGCKLLPAEPPLLSGDPEAAVIDCGAKRKHRREERPCKRARCFEPIGISKAQQEGEYRDMSLCPVARKRAEIDRWYVCILSPIKHTLTLLSSFIRGYVGLEPLQCRDYATPCGPE